MGCDIHFYVEKKVDGAWKLQGELVNDDGCKYVSGPDFYDGRNYNLFAILADVRNGRGFAGIKTGEGFNPISDPRGVPDDASDEYKQLVDCWDADGHSHSHHTLRQLLDYDWTQTTGLQGWCSMDEYLPWAAYGDKLSGPKGYCGGVSGGGVQHLTDEEAVALAEQYRALSWGEHKSFIEGLGHGKYALAKWQEHYHQAAGSFWARTIPKLLKLAGGTAGLDDVRCVFFFDN